MDVRVTVDDHDADRRLGRLVVFISDLRSFWPTVATLYTSWMRRQFETEGAFAGQPWQPLAASTVGRKLRAGLRPNILQATGAMKRAASRPIRRATPHSLTLTIDSDYLRFHQEGDGVPERPLVFGSPLVPQAAAELAAAAELYIRDLLKRL